VASVEGLQPGQLGGVVLDRVGKREQQAAALGCRPC